jgi:hypothetical protein
MKKKYFVPFFVSCFGVMGLFGADLADLRISFSTTGPDRYSDGTVVLDGECYALVWSKNGNFDGFTASGAPVDPDDKVILIAPIAKGGRCPSVLFQVPEAVAAACAGGAYEVYLVDTRLAEGGAAVPGGLEKGKLKLVNGYGEVSAELSIGSSESTARAETLVKDEGQVASQLPAAPADLAQPKIKAMDVGDEYVYLTVENLKGYLRVQSGPTVSAAETTGAATESKGDTEDVILIAPKKGQSGFYRVIRN